MINHFVTAPFLYYNEKSVINTRISRILITDFLVQSFEAVLIKRS